MSQELEQKLYIAEQKIKEAKSKAYDTITQIMEEKEAIKSQALAWQGVVEKIAGNLGLDNATVDDIYSSIEELKESTKGELIEK